MTQLNNQTHLTNLFKTAHTHHKAGRLAKAEQLYRQILQTAPKHPQTLHLLGLIAHQTGHHQQAIDLIKQAIAQNNKIAAFHNNLGNAFQALHKLASAAKAYRQALHLKPNYPQALCNLANILNKREQPEKAIQHYQQAIKLAPTFVEAYLSLGHLWQTQNNLTQAQHCYQQALHLNPNHPQTHFNLGNLHRQRGNIPAAIHSFQAAIRTNPTFAEAYNNLGAVLQLSGNIEKATACFQRVLALHPNHVQAHFNLGSALKAQNNLNEAITHYQQALAQEPPFATQIFYHLLDTRLKLADWSTYQPDIQELIHRTTNHINQNTQIPLPLLTLNALPLSPAFRAAIATHQARYISHTVAQLNQVLQAQDSAPLNPPKRETLKASPPSGKTLKASPPLGGIEGGQNIDNTPNLDLNTAPSPLRIGYVSPDFRQHAVGNLIRHLFAHHNPTTFQTYAYSLFETDDEINRQIKTDCQNYRDISKLSTLQAAQHIQNDGIHILIDLAGHTTFSRPAIFALQPAPVQAHYLGYLDTMGADFLPYIIADSHVITPQMATHYTEAIVRLPDSFIITAPMPIAKQEMTRSECNLLPHAFVFCCFNRLHKIDPEVFAAWMQILKQVPHSILWLYGEQNSQGLANLQQEANRHNIKQNRLIFAPRVPLPNYLARYRLADLFLDTFVYNAGATAIGALWAGLPVLTRPGNTFLNRMGSSFNTAANLPELICNNTDTYIKQAIHLATNPKHLATLRHRLTTQRDSLPLFNTKRFIKHLEQAYKQMWLNHTTGTGPQNITINSEQ